MKNTGYYLLIVILFLSIKWSYRYAGNEQLYFLLKPTDAMVGLFLNADSVYHPDSGFWYEKYNMVINKSCSGMNFLLICFLMLAFSGVHLISGRNRKIGGILILLVLSYLFTPFVNTSRIMTAVFIREWAFLQEVSRIHEAQGAFVYLFFLIGIYFLFQYTCAKKPPVETGICKNING